MTADLLDHAREFALASMIAGYPDEDLAASLGDLGDGLGDHGGVGPMIAALGRGLDDLQAAYIDLFDRGKDRVSLYETEHGHMRGLAKGHDLADLAGFYKAFGLALDHDAAHELLDHLAVELEFYAALLFKQDLLARQGDDEGCAIVEDARRKFLLDHLGRFAGVVAREVAARGDAVYAPALAWCATLVAAECARLGVSPAPLEAGRHDEARDDGRCGAVHLPVVS